MSEQDLLRQRSQQAAQHDREAVEGIERRRVSLGDTARGHSRRGSDGFMRRLSFRARKALGRAKGASQVRSSLVEQQDLEGNRVRDQWQELQDVQEAVQYYPRPLPSDDLNQTPRGLEPSLFARMIRGRSVLHEKDLKNDSNTVRLYLSSSFTDMKFERDCIVGLLVPRIRQYCREHGLSFRMTDMRWALSDSTNDSRDVSLGELQACKDRSTSHSFNFIGILGNRYGFCPFPAKIHDTLFYTLREEASDKALLDKWFVLDKNVIPPLYMLKAAKDVIWQNKRNRMDAHNIEWWRNFRNLQAVLRQAATRCLRGGKISAEEAVLFHQSVVEEEIKRGVLYAPDQYNTHVIIRELNGDGLEEDQEYFDVTSSSIVGDDSDEDSVNRLNALKAQILHRFEDSPQRLTQFNVPYDGGLDPINNIRHRQYLNDMLAKLESVIIQTIKQELAKGRQKRDDVFREVQRHAQWAYNLNQHFVGREASVESIYSSPGRLVLIHGDAGVGKTSIIAKAWVNMATEHGSMDPRTIEKPQDEGMAIIVRFVDMTHLATTSANMLRSIYRQIQRLYPKETEYDLKFRMPTRERDMKKKFLDFLSLASEERPLTIMIDGVDQLRDEDTSWLPTKGTDLPPFVRLILSARSRSQTNATVVAEIVREASKKEFNSSTQVIKIKKLKKVEHAEAMLDAWLALDKRRLQPDQKSFLLESFSQMEVPSPLILRVMYSEAVKWGSYSSFPDWGKAKTLRDLLTVLFEGFENEHGPKFVRRVCGLITASADGLRMSELEDLLSLDNELLKDAFSNFLPPLARFPQRVMTKIRADLGPFLWSTNWSHREFSAFARQRYADDQRIAHDQLALYFSNVSGSDIDIESEKVMIKGQECIIAKVRYLAPQPFYFKASGINRRKMIELPSALLAKGDVDQLEKAVCSYDFVRYSLMLEPLDLLAWLKTIGSPRANRIALAVTSALAALQANPEGLDEFMWLRLVPLLDADDQLVKDLNARRLKQAGLHAKHALELHKDVKEKSMSKTVDEGLDDPSTVIRGLKPVNSMATYVDPENQDWLIATTSEAGLRIWNTEDKRAVVTFNHPDDQSKVPGAVATITEMESKVVRVAAAFGLDVVICSMKTKKISRLIRTKHEGSVNALAFISHKTILDLISAGQGGRIRIWNAVSGKQQRAFDCKQGPVLQIEPFTHPTEGTWHILGVHEDAIKVYDRVEREDDDFEDEGQDLEFSKISRIGETFADAVTFFHNGVMHTVSCSAKHASLFVWSLEDGNLIRQLNDEEHWNEPFTAVDVIRDSASGGVRCVTGDDQGHVKVWDPVEGKLLASFAAHKTAVSVVSPFIYDSEICVASAGSDGRLCIFKSEDMASQNEQVREVALEIASYNSDKGWRIVTGHKSGIRVWNPQTMELVAQFTSPSEVLCTRTYDVMRSPMARVVAGRADGKVTIWRIPEDTSSDIEILKPGHPVTAAAIFEPRSRTSPLVAASGHDGEVFIFEIETSEKIASFSAHDGRPIIKMQTFTDNEGCKLVTIANDSKLMYWDMENIKKAGFFSGATVQKTSEHALYRPVLSMSAHTDILSGEARVLVCSTEKTSTLVIDLSGSERKLRGHNDVVHLLSGFPDPKTNAQFVITASRDKSILIWHAAHPDNKPLASYFFDQQITAIGAHRLPHVVFVFAGLEDGQIAVLNFVPKDGSDEK